ncbi:MAG TPA: molybdenum cofactor biosynthesis protein MoaE [Chloroflexota bacterium]|jgi:molybdopterin synthase catalytic subunit|nr:molybdenum cofactor biosynthesis protein MoaE [Chloroflexota bacterium]
MRIHVRYFAYYREQLGRGEEWAEVEEGTDVAALWRRCTADHPRLTGVWDATAVAVNGIYAGRDAVLHEGDEVAFLPPVSGGAARCRLTEDVLDIAALEAEAHAPRHGAVVLFVGIVRETSPTGKPVQYLEYEAYPGMAEAEMERITVEVERRWENSTVVMAHRVGRLAIGEASVAIAVATPHRAAAFEACRYAIDRLKETVPIWKKEVFVDGSQWVGMGA